MNDEQGDDDDVDGEAKEKRNEERRRNTNYVCNIAYKEKERMFSNFEKKILFIITNVE